MRLHSMALQAIGPFKGRHTIDFDRLCESGLFLLHGPTGAGKSTVFDAICLALYGEAPTRNTQRLRSDHADPGTPTQVILDFTVTGRRLQVTRTPKQLRRKADGTFRQVPAKATLQERAPAADGTGQWTLLSNSHQEVGTELKALLGMSREQFCQVILLPQNDFARFLSAKASERTVLLGHLFKTSRFKDIGGWIAKQSKKLQEQRDTAHTGVVNVIERIHQAAGEEAEAATGPAPDHDQPEAFADNVLPWLQRLLDHTAHLQQHTATAEAAARGSFAHLQQHTALARSLAERQDRYRQAHQQRETRNEQAAEHQARRHRFERAQQADHLAPLLDALQEAETLAATAQEAEQHARSPLPAEHTAAAPEELLAAAHNTAVERGRLDALREEEAQQAQLTADLAHLEAERVQARQEHQEASDWLEDHPKHHHQLTTRLQDARQAEEDANRLTAALATSSQQLEAARRRDALAALAAQARQHLTDRQATTQEALHHLVDIRERRTKGMAAALAADLTDGTPCPVCGSCTHPHPATGHEDQPTRADEHRADQAHQKATKLQDKSQAALHEIDQQVAEARGEAGQDPVNDLEAQHNTLTSQHETALALAADATPAQEELAALEREHTTRHSDHTATSTRLAAYDTRHEGLTRELADLTQRLDAARGPAPSVTARIEQLNTLVEHLDTAARHAQATATATTQLNQRTTHTTTAVQDAHFSNPDDARNAQLSEADLHALRDDLQRWNDEEAALNATLADPTLLEATALPAVDLNAIQQAMQEATDNLNQAAVQATTSATRHQALTTLATQLRTRLTDLEPLEEDYCLAHRLATLTAGNPGDNQLSMQLEAYVLAACLEDVVEAANQRLLRMSDDRYLLAHTDQKTTGSRGRSGLGLQVMDAWTGRERDTDTLSGGESFFVSLALALGLADVVAHETGGTALNTLFIDEGFGTLDEDTLNKVLGVLDQLREHDRVVGVVSHVTDLRLCIPAQLHVRKGQDGSTLDQSAIPPA